MALIGLGDSNKKAAGRLKNDLRRSLGKQFSSKTRDLLAHVEQRMAVCTFMNQPFYQPFHLSHPLLCSLSLFRGEFAAPPPPRAFSN